MDTTEANLATNVQIAEAADRARRALDAAIAEPSCSRHRVDLTNALNYIETIVRQETVA